MTTATLPAPRWGTYLRQNVLPAVIVTPIITVIVYLVLEAIGWMPDTVLVQPANQPITVIPVVMLTIMSTLGASLVYAGLQRFTATPTRIFYIVAAVVFLIMAIPPFSLPNVPTEMIIALQVLHVAAAVPIVWLLTRRTA
ncbi:MAG: DUF6069 family protein [Anaerolineae bacterium]|jgi:hypothetical protein|nr:DUF6069 family protein [Anaerolineae bacterium]